MNLRRLMNIQINFSFAFHEYKHFMNKSDSYMCRNRRDQMFCMSLFISGKVWRWSIAYYCLTSIQLLTMSVMTFAPAWFSGTLRVNWASSKSGGLSCKSRIVTITGTTAVRGLLPASVARTNKSYLLFDSKSKLCVDVSRPLRVSILNLQTIEEIGI